jgi:hypothetical protein
MVENQRNGGYLWAFIPSAAILDSKIIHGGSAGEGELAIC